MEDINEIFNKCLCNRESIGNPIVDLTNYIYNKSISAIRLQKRKWFTDCINDDETHFLSVTYNVVSKNIEKYRLLDPEINLDYFTSICVKEIKLSVNNFNRNLISQGNLVLTNSISFDDAKSQYIETRIARDESIDIELDAKYKLILDQILKVVDPDQANIIVYKLKGLSFEEIAVIMNTTKNRVAYLFYSIKNNPQVKKIYRENKMKSLF